MNIIPNSFMANLSKIVLFNRNKPTKTYTLKGGIFHVVYFIEFLDPEKRPFLKKIEFFSSFPPLLFSPSKIPYVVNLPFKVYNMLY